MQSVADIFIAEASDAWNLVESCGGGEVVDAVAPAAVSALFTSEKNLKAGSMTFWILKATFGVYNSELTDEGGKGQAKQEQKGLVG